MREPTYVAAPREPRPQPRLVQRWVTVAMAAALVLAVAVGWLLFALRGQQDPALEVGAPGPDTASVTTAAAAPA